MPSLRWLALVVLVIALTQNTTSAIQCNTTGNAGQYGNLIKSVLVDFEAPVSTNYTANELAACFYVTFSSGRYLIIETAEIMSGTVVNITFRNLFTGNPEMQTGASLSVLFTPLSGITRKLLVNGVEQAPGVVCASTADKTKPALIKAPLTLASISTGIAFLFSEPVERCGGGNLLLSDLTMAAFSGCNATLTPVPAAPSSVWYVNCTGVGGGGYTVAVPAGVACDATGNQGIASATRTPATDSSLFTDFIDLDPLTNRFYDLDGDGLVDAVLLLSKWAFNNELVNSGNTQVQVNEVDVANLVASSEYDSQDNTVLLRFDGVAVVGSVTVSSTLTNRIGPVQPADSVVYFVTAYDRIPPRLDSAVAAIGSNQVILTTSEPYTTSLALSQFDVISSDGITITGFTGTPTTTQINATLSVSLTVASLSNVKFYLKLQEYESAYYEDDTLGHGRPPWVPLAPTLVLLGGYITRVSASDGWDTLVVNFSSPLTEDDVSTSNLLIAATGYTFTVTAATLLTDYDVRYTISYECANSSSPCASTLGSDFAFSVTGNSVVDPSFAITPDDQAGPLPITVVGIVGHNSLRLVFSEPIAFDDSLVSQSVPFDIHSNGLTATAVVPNATDSATYDLTLSRTLRSSDTSALLSSDVVTLLVDTTGNVGSALLTRPPFILSATAHDDDDDGFVDRIRLQTTLPHQEFTSSGGFQTPLTFTFGDVTRVDANTTDIAVVDGPSVEEGIVIEYASGTLNMRLLSTDGVRSGVEMIRASFPVFTASTNDTTTITVVEEQEGMTYALAGGLIAGAFVVGSIVTYSLCRNSTSSRKIAASTRKKHRRKVQRYQSDDDGDNDDSDIELME